MLCRWFLLAIAILTLPGFLLSSRGGGSGLNVVVVANQQSPASLELANYYLQRRQVPPQNLVRINWTGGNVQWSWAEFADHLLTPLTNSIAVRGLSNQIELVVLSTDIPYRVYRGGDAELAGVNSTTSALFYGFKPDGPPEQLGLPASCNLPDTASNSYAASELPFTKLQHGGFLATMITSSNLAQAKQTIDIGIASDGSFPLHPVYLAKSSDRLRNLRYWTFDDAVIDTLLLGYPTLIRTNSDLVEILRPASGYSGGLAAFSASAGLFVPGAMADQLTSYAGMLFEPNDQTTVLAFLNASASGSYGTIIEPCSHLEKFPSPRNYFYQARGFNLAESYYQSITVPYQGLIVGEPLAAPFAVRASGSWLAPANGTVLKGVTNLSVHFTAPGQDRPIGRVALFMDGRYTRDLRLYEPAGGEIIQLSIAGQGVSLLVSNGASLSDITTNLAAEVNRPEVTNLTKVVAAARGDRVELKSLDLSRSAAEINLQAGITSTAESSSTFLHATEFLDAPVHAVRSYAVTNMPAAGDYLRLRVKLPAGETVVISSTNETGNLKLADLVKNLVQAFNGDAVLSKPEGLVIEDINMHEDYPYNEYVYGTNDHSGEFNVRARSLGALRSQAEIELSGSGALEVKPSGNKHLDENIEDLRPRAHLYLAHGTTNVDITFPLDTRELADGYHTLEVVGYEGTHVQTQTRLAADVMVRNTGLEATLEIAGGATHVALDSEIPFRVIANGTNIASIELLGNGGVLAVVEGASEARLSLPAATLLGAGSHRFQARVIARDGGQFVTAPQTVLIDGAQPQYEIAIGPPRVTLEWPAVFGRTYQVFGGLEPWSASNLITSITATNGWISWRDTNMVPKRFYRVGVQP
jgi:uncharacterized protein (TIGR03790 family)